jgi:hypothetical protein
MEQTDEQLKQYARSLADRLGVKVDWSKVSDDDLLRLIFALKNEYEGH